MRTFLRVVLLGAASALQLRQLPGLHAARAQPLRAAAPTASAEDEPKAGVGFSPEVNAAAVARGQKSLEAMRKQAGVAPTPPPEPELYIPTQEEKNTVVYGLAGFLILAGIASLFIGGPVWESKGALEDGSAPAESAGLFGFAPTQKELEQVAQAQSASQPPPPPMTPPPEEPQPAATMADEAQPAAAAAAADGS